MNTPLHLENIKQAPKALLHDHLDGGLRPATVLDIAGQVGYDRLPATDVESLETWFRTASHSGSLERYLEPFSHTVAVMQTPEALHRVAYECVEDLAADSVVYAEVRFAPELHIDEGLSFDEVLASVLAGFADGERACAAEGNAITVRCLVTAMRHAAMSREIAELAIRFRDKGVVGFDIAGVRLGTLRLGTSTLLSTCVVIMRASLFMRVRRSGCHLSTRRSRSAELTGWATGCGSSTTSTLILVVASGWVPWPRSCGTSEYRWSCAPARTCKPARWQASPSTRLICWPGHVSG